MPHCTVRLATENDLGFILRCIRLLAQYEKLSHELQVNESNLRVHLFEKKYAEVLIAEHSGEKAGIALFFHNYSTFAGRPGIYLEDLYVLEQFRGKGCGQKLLVELARLALDRGCARLEWSVLDWNDPAINFYRAMGAEPVTGWSVYRMTGPSLNDLALREI